MYAPGAPRPVRPERLQQAVACNADKKRETLPDDGAAAVPGRIQVCEVEYGEVGLAATVERPLGVGQLARVVACSEGGRVLGSEYNIGGSKAGFYPLLKLMLLPAKYKFHIDVINHLPLA